MRTYTASDRYTHRVLGVVEELHSSMVGTGEMLPEERFGELVDWLVWRVTDGWEETNKVVTRSDGTPLGVDPLRLYDNRVRSLARAVLLMASLR